MASAGPSGIVCVVGLEMCNNSKNQKDEGLITFIDDTIDAGKEPLARTPMAQRIHDEFMKKYGQKNKKRIRK